MLNPFINLINQVVFIINLLLFIWVVLDVLIHFDIVNRHNALVQRVHGTLGRLLEPLLHPIRRLLQKYLPNLGIDISPVILILLLNFLVDLLYQWFYTT